MSPVQLFCGLLVLAFVTCPALSQGEACATGIKTCTDQFMTAFGDGSGVMAAGPCKVLQSFMDCVFSLECPIPESQKQMIINQAMAPLKAQGIDCGDMSGSGGGAGMGTGTGTGSGSGTGMGSGGMGSGTGYETGDGSVGPGQNMDKMMIVGQIFMGHNCANVLNECGKKINSGEGVPECRDVKTAGQCMFRECPDIKGTEDERKAADALIEFTKGFGCKFTADDLLNGSIGVLKRPIWESLAVFLAAALVKKFLV